MKKLLFSIIFVIFLIFTLFATSQIDAQDNSELKLAKPGKLTKLYILGSDEVINKDVFAVGDRVDVSGTVNGDVYALGSEIFVDGTVNGDLLAAGGTVNIT